MLVYLDEVFLSRFLVIFDKKVQNCSIGFAHFDCFISPIFKLGLKFFLWIY